jgi:hypothetical protein
MTAVMRGRGAAGGVQHQQELDQMLLHRRHQGLDQEHVALTAVRVQLHPEAVVGEALQPGRQQRGLQMSADLGGEIRMRAAAEHRDLAQRLVLPPMARGRAYRRRAAPDQAV